MSTSFPYPIPEYGAEAFWAACDDERLVMQRCDSCDKFRWHPAPRCDACGNDGFQWTELSGQGVVHSWTRVTHPVHPAAHDKVPYVVAEIELAEQSGLTMISNIVKADSERVAIGAAVRLIFDKHPNGQKLPVFALEV
ncbi:MAG: OB-fold domain-containing protein [Pseudomonadota bacterium]